MARIVGIHGIAQQYCGGYELASVWFDALRDGLDEAGQEAKAKALTADDVVVSFFGSLFRPAGAMGQGPPYSAQDVQPGLERDLLAELYLAAVDQEPSLGAPSEAMAGRVAVLVMVERLLRSRTFAKVAERALIGDLKQVSRFLDSPETKQSVLDRVRRQVGDGTRVVIGHSLGSVIAYEYLCRYRPESVELLVTLGSPLGIPNLVFDRLTPRPTGGKGAWPAPVARWVNVADRNDIVAMRKQLAELFPGPAPDQQVDDRLVDNGDEPHAIRRYLNAPETGSAIGDALP
ncbi:alpha/beta fold hydrolase [Streptomyces sp. KR55]|uniref:alpha/beta fold hydrolase n=1 Tax=Streptomyces sp. KR55 TaxID=3457425 RepID=UPI003FD6B946